MNYLILALPLVITIAGCQKDPALVLPYDHGPISVTSADTVGYTLSVYDASGKLVAAGDLFLPRELPTPGRRIEGGWRLTSSSDSFPSGGVSTDKYSCEVNDKGISIDLHPGTADDNVTLEGVIKDGSWTGDWFYATEAGGKAMGKFTLIPDSTLAR